MLKTSLGANDEGAGAISAEELEQLIARNANTVYKLAYAKVGNRADADDIFQQVFLRYLKKKPSFANADHERAWFLRVTANCTKSWWNSANHRHRGDLTEDIPAAHTAADKPDLTAYLMQLPRNYRTVIHLFYYEDMTTADIARLLKKRESTVRMQLTRARRQLKEILEKEHRKEANDVEF